VGRGARGPLNPQPLTAVLRLLSEARPYGGPRI
jgi:hypothetical protein